MDTRLFKWTKPWHNVHSVYSAQSLGSLVFLLKNQKICRHHYTSLPLNPILSHFKSLHMLLHSLNLFQHYFHTLVSRSVPTNIFYLLPVKVIGYRSWPSKMSLFNECKGKVVPVHGIQPYRGSRVIAPLILHPRERTPLHNEQKTTLFI